MLIGVLSDTHSHQLEAALTSRLAQVFAGAEMILHAGDAVTLETLAGLSALPGGEKVLAVAGNMDGPAVKANWPRKQVVEVEGRRIGLIHGGGAPMGLAGRVRKEFDDVEAIVFGHSHRPFNAVKDGVLLFNPGSVSHGFMGSGTVGRLQVGPEGLSGEIIKLWD